MPQDDILEAVKEDEKLSSDTNFDGKINALDLLRIQKHILGKSTL